jgi:hypothetical protein
LVGIKLNIFESLNKASQIGAHEALMTLCKEQIHKDPTNDEYILWLETKISFLTEELIGLANKSLF